MFKTKCCRQFWVDDTKAPRCHRCSASFKVVRRRHHCRCCGHVYCRSCTTARAPVLPLCRIATPHPPPYSIKEKRVCKKCHLRFSSLKMDGQSPEYLLGGMADRVRSLKAVDAGNFNGYLYKSGSRLSKWVDIDKLNTLSKITTVCDVAKYLQSRQSDPDCVICLDSLGKIASEYRDVNNKRTCRHMLHYKCALEWESQCASSPQCPTCRKVYNVVKQIKNYNYISSSSEDPSEDPIETEILPDGVDYFLADLKNKVSYKLPKQLVATNTKSCRRFNLSEMNGIP